MLLNCVIPHDILQLMERDYACFIEKQSDYMYRIFILPTMNDNNNGNSALETANMLTEIQSKIRASIFVC